MPTGKTLCCLRFERKGQACHDCPLLEILPLTMQPGWLQRLRQHNMVQKCLGKWASRYLIRLKQRVKATIRR